MTPTDGPNILYVPPGSERYRMSMPRNYKQEDVKYGNMQYYNNFDWRHESVFDFQWFIHVPSIR